jgi:hypothetical protein
MPIAPKATISAVEMQATLAGIRIDRYASAIAALFTLVFTIGLFVLSRYEFPLDPTILASHVEEFRMQSTRPQFYFYLTLLGLFGSLCALLLLRPDARIVPSAGRWHLLLMGCVVAAAIALGSWSNPFMTGMVVAAFGLAVARFRSNRQPSSARPPASVSSLAALGLITAFVVIIQVAPLARPLPVRDVTGWVVGQAHYAGLLPGFDLACCSRGVGIERLDYGVGMALLTAGAVDLFQAFGAPDGMLVQLVRTYQIIAVAMVCLSSWLANRRLAPQVALLALGLAGFTLGNIGLAVALPNQSGIRYIFFLAALIVLTLEIRRPPVRDWVLVPAAALFTLLSPEIGAAILATFGVASLLGRYDPKAPATTIGLVAVRTIAIFLVAAAIGAVSIVRPFYHGSLDGLFHFLVTFAGGYGGLVAKPDIAAIFLFFFALRAMLRSVARAREQPLDGVDCYQAGLGAGIAVWMIYYINRMDGWNLWFELILFTLMLAPRLELDSTRFSLRRISGMGAAEAILALVFIAGQVTESTTHLAWDGLRWATIDWNACVTVNGVCVRSGDGAGLVSALDHLATDHARADTIVLSGAATQIRLLGFNQGFPWYEPFAEVMRTRDVAALADWIERSPVKQVIADDPDSVVARATPERNRQIRDILGQLPSFHPTRSDAGWVVYERTSEPE